MQAPATPPDEAQRLSSLRSLALLDTPIEERFDRITRLARRVFQVPTAMLSLVDADRQWFKSVQGCEVRSTPREVSFCGHAILTDEVMIVPDARRDPRFHDNPLVTSAHPVVFYAGCPVKATDGSNIGVLCLNSDEPRAIDERDVQTLQDLAGIVETEVALRVVDSVQAELMKELAEAHRQAMLDPLTFVWNREGIERVLHRTAGPREPGAVAVIMADVDHFKGVNDTYGHATGDEVLREVARRMTRASRPGDSVGRVGGEEFVVCVAPPVTAEQARSVGERIRAQVGSTPVVTRAGDIHVTISIGVAVADPGCTDAESLIARADRAMYHAKHTGRDRVCIDGEEPRIAA